MEKKNNWLIVVLVIIILCLGGYIVYDKVIKKDEVKTEQKENNEKEDIKEETSSDNSNISNVDSNESKELTDDIIKNMFIEKMKENKFIDESNLKEYNLNEVNYKGYFKSTGQKLYSITGTFECVDGSTSCFYIDQVGDKEGNKYSFNINIYITDNGNGSYESSIGGAFSYNSDFVSA